MSKLKEITGNKWFIVLGSALILLLLFAQIRQYENRRGVNKEIDKLAKQADQLQKNNNDLQSMIAYFNTDSYKEKTAREQLDLRKDGETVYSFAAPQQTQTAEEQRQQEDAAALAKQSNPGKWWSYFFGGQD